MENIARSGCLASKYSWISMLHYADTKEQALKILSNNQWTDKLLVARDVFENNAIVAVTFAAMALEAFFNDYAAQKFGDKFYYDNFEMLRPTGKLQMIVKFVFGIELKKGEYLFQLVDRLFKLRNEYVHNKSKDGRAMLMTEEEYVDYEEAFFCSEEIPIYKDEIEEILGNAAGAIKALCEVAKFFEQFDGASKIPFRLVLAGALGNYDKVEYYKVKQIQKEFKVLEIRDVSEEV